MTVETLSEVLFKKHCAERGIPCRRIEEGQKKVADFELSLDCGLVVAEIKQMDPNEEDRARQSLPPGTIRGAGYGPTTRVRNMLSDAYGQIKSYAAAGLPGIVVCYNNAGGVNHIDNFTVTRAMFGEMAVNLALGKDNVIHHAGRMFTGKRKVTRNTLRGLSAVCVLSAPSKGETQLIVYHNPYASCPLALHALGELADDQFGYDDPHGMLNPIFLAKKLEMY